MALKTFNVDAQAYEEFSKHCKENGISMSKKVENFIKEELERIKFGKVPDRVMLNEKKESNSVKTEAENSFRKYC